MLVFAIVGSRSGQSTAGAGPTTTTQTSTTSTRGTPSSTRRRSVSTANTRPRSSRTWREARLCSRSGSPQRTFSLQHVKNAAVLLVQSFFPQRWGFFCTVSEVKTTIHFRILLFLINRVQLSSYLAPFLVFLVLMPVVYPKELF